MKEQQELPLPVEPPKEKLWVVRLYDGMDNQWIDVSEPVSRAEAQSIWNEKTGDGKHNIEFADIDYYKVYPADTRMLYSDGFGETQR